MIKLFYENLQRNKFDILYGVEPHHSRFYHLDYLTEQNLEELEQPNTFFLMDQSTLMGSTFGSAAFVAYNRNSSILLYNKPHKTAAETLSFYEKLSLTSGAVMVIGQEASEHIHKFQETTQHIECAIEDLDYVIYPGNGNYDNDEEGGFDPKLVIYAHGKVAQYFRNYCMLRWKEFDDTSEEGEEGYKPPFAFSINPDSDSNLFMTFEQLTREETRMLDGRFRNIFVPFTSTYGVFDPRSFFKANPQQIAEMAAGMTEHQAAAMLRQLFEALYDYIIDVFVPEPSVNTMKINGNVDLFQAIAYNLNRTV